MKKIIKYTFGLLALLALSCYDGIDPITKVDPGADMSAPVVNIISPTEGTTIKVFENVTSFDVKIEVTDDIEISNISILLDNSEIMSYSSFMDYRRALEEFTYSNLVDGEHVLKVVATDTEGKSTTKTVNFSKEPPYTPLFDGEVLYMPFDGDYRDLIGFEIADQVGSPGFAGTSYAGSNAYKGATDSYLNFPSEGLQNNEFSAAFWYKANGSPDRAGILVAGDDATDRKQGFRLFREGSTTSQRIKLNVGTGAGESWNDGGLIDVTADEWVHVAFTISQTETKIYFNGIEVNSATLSAPIDWTGVGPLTIGSGGPTFSYWNHKSDNSAFDELRVFNKALSQAEIQIMLNSFNPYVPQYDGESFYMPFEGGYINLVGNTAAAEVGSPSITDNAYVGTGAYMGATDSYLTHPAGNLLSSQFSASFWYKVDATPDRAGILVVGADENRTQGFRLFREGSATSQRIKLNVGTGGGESWNDGDVIDVTAGQWVHIAMTISDTENKIFLNGVEVRSSAMSAPIDWTGCSEIVIGSGGPTFSYWNHKSDNSIIDDLRFFNKALSTQEVVAVFGGDYTPPYYGSMFYMPFEGTNVDKVSNTNATVVGTPGFAGESKVGTDSYAGATDAYLTFPTTGLLGSEFSAAMWYKLNASPDRAGILVISPEDTGNANYPDVQNKRTSGFRFFRENAGGKQRFKLNVGNGSADVWFDGGTAADVDPAAGWVHLAFTISATECVVYINGQVVKQGAFTGVDWSGCDLMSIMSGKPRFTEWGHFSDLSYLDDLLLFDHALTQEEIQALMTP